MSLEFSYRVLHTAVHGLAPHKVFYPAQVLVETVGSGRNRDEGGGGKRAWPVAWQAAARELDYAFLRFLWDENG